MERKIIAIKYGETVFNENFIFQGGNPKKMLPISFVIYLIQDASRNILVDAGCNDGAGFEMSIFNKPVNILQDYGVKPEDITDIVITHHHHDHIEAVADYPNARVHMQKDEYELGKHYIPQTMQVETFEEEKTLGNGLEIKKIGGHSIGSSIVICNCSGEEYVFCGDECYVKACLENKIPTGASYAPEISEQFIREYGKGCYKQLLFHEPSIFAGKLGYISSTVPKSWKGRR